MKQSYIPIYVFVFLLILTIPFSFDEFSLEFATSVVPGWHTTILPPYFLINLIVSLIMLFVIIFYWKISKKTNRVNLKIFFIHLLLTIPAIIEIAWPLIIDNLLMQHIESIGFQSIVSLITAPYILFIGGQIIFFVYYIRTFKIKPAEI